MSVVTYPGMTALTRMLRRPISRATHRVIAMRPAFDAAYAACPGTP